MNAATASSSYTSNINNGIPRFVQYASPVSMSPLNPNGTGAALPLNIVAMIVALLDEPADLASVTRTCRLLYYMALPSLYKIVHLHSYPEIRYVNGRPEGFGSGSPFLMALNGLIAGSHAGHVKELRLFGELREPGVEEFGKGRVPDNYVMLNTIVRAALARTTQLQTLMWQLDCKPLKTLYQGLQSSTSLTSLTLKFPSARDPRPSVMIPPMANLKKFKATDIDPLCYPDDISMLLFGSKKLEDLRLHFSPRIRREAECSLSLDTYFGRCLRSGYQIPLKHLGIQNFFGPNTQGMEKIAKLETMRSMCAFDMFGQSGGSHGGSRNIFLDSTWDYAPKDVRSRFTTMRCNEKSTQHVQLLANAEVGQDNMYFVNAKCPQFHQAAPTPPGGSPPSQEAAMLGKQYLDVLNKRHGQTMKRLLLSDQWILDQQDIADLVRHCPNLEQLAVGTSNAQHSVLRMLIPFLPKLKALRLLSTDGLCEHLRVVSDEKRREMMGRDLYKSGHTALKWIGIADYIFKTGEAYSVTLDDGSQEWRREIADATAEDVKDVEIWSMDNLDLDADPVWPFEP